MRWSAHRKRGQITGDRNMTTDQRNETASFGSLRPVLSFAKDEHQQPTHGGRHGCPVLAARNSRSINTEHVGHVELRPTFLEPYLSQIRIVGHVAKCA